MSTAAYVFGKYRYSSASGLRAAGRPVALGQCPQRCLEVLLAARGALVHKDQLIRTVWHGTASDSSLARSIYLLRQALDDGDAIIDTVYGRGYRIAVPVHVAGEHAAATAGTFARGTPAAQRIFRFRSHLALAQGDLPRALAEYDAAIERAPLDGDAAAGRAWTVFLAGRTQDALKALRAATARWPDVDTGHASLAAVASWAGHHDEAIAAARRSIEINDGLPNFATPLVFALARAGRIEEARAVLVRLEASPDGPPSPSMLVPVHLALGDRARAAGCAELARRTDVAWRHTLDIDPRVAELRMLPGVPAAAHVVLAEAAAG